MHIESGAIAYAHAQAFCAVMHKLVLLLRPEGDDTRLSEASHQQNGAQKARHNEAEREIKLQEVSEAQRRLEKQVHHMVNYMVHYMVHCWSSVLHYRADLSRC